MTKTTQPDLAILENVYALYKSGILKAITEAMRPEYEPLVPEGADMDDIRSEEHNGAVFRHRISMTYRESHLPMVPLPPLPRADVYDRPMVIGDFLQPVGSVPEHAFVDGRIKGII